MKSAQRLEKAVLDSSGSSRVYRGGSWNVDANYCSVAIRNGNSPNVCISSFLGFRVVRAAN